MSGQFPNGDPGTVASKNTSDLSIANLVQCMPACELVHWPPSWPLSVRRDKRVRTGTDYQEYFSQICQDVKTRGVIQPIIAVRKGDVGETIDGETRRLAALVCGCATIPVLLYDHELSESDLIVAQLQANEIRREFTDLERGDIYARLMQLNGWSQAQLARCIHVKPAQISRVMAVSSKLPEDVRAMIGEGEGKIPPSSAYQLSKLSTPELMRDFAAKVSQGHLTRDGLESEVARHSGKRRKREKPVKVAMNGITLIFAERGLENIVSALALLEGAIKKLQRHGLPLASLPSLVNGQPGPTLP